MKHREILKDKKRIIVKVGTALLTDDTGKINLIRLERLAMVVSGLQDTGKQVILVSSGAVGAGIGKMKFDEKPGSLIDKQALAAIGQAALLRMYDTFFNEYDKIIGQVLLTRDGLENSKRRGNARNTINRMLELGVIPIINENDTVATEEIEFGDNDLLSAMVADLVNADLLIILTNTHGVYTADPNIDKNAKPLLTVINADEDLKGINLDGQSHHGSGGMQTKIMAAKLCREKNIDTVIAQGTDPSMLIEIMEGKMEGTLFVSEATRMMSDKEKTGKP
jgi:glutamate 5-kinase